MPGQVLNMLERCFLLGGLRRKQTAVRARPILRGFSGTPEPRATGDRPRSFSNAHHSTGRFVDLCTSHT